MDNNIIDIHIGKWETFYTDSLFQWDKGQKFRFDDISDGTELQFAEGGMSIVTDGIAKIPDIYLQESGEHRAWIRIVASSHETTIKQIVYTVKPKEKPTDYIPADEVESFREQMQAVIDSTKANAEVAEQAATQAALDANQAKESAVQASENASNAGEVATAASNVATAASEVASSAAEKSDEAKSIAEEAKTKSTSAEQNAGEALLKATEALSTASTANANSDEALSNSQQALAKATDAETKTNEVYTAYTSGALKGADGKDGSNGKDGYTPIKGVDYFDGINGENGKDYVLTDADKQDIANLVPGGGSADTSGIESRLDALESKEQYWDEKQDKITDLENIRSGASESMMSLRIDNNNVRIYASADDLSITKPFAIPKDTGSVLIARNNVTFECFGGGSEDEGWQYQWQYSNDGGATYASISGGGGRTASTSPSASRIYRCRMIPPKNSGLDTMWTDPIEYNVGSPVTADDYINGLIDKKLMTVVPVAVTLSEVIGT